MNSSNYTCRPDLVSVGHSIRLWLGRGSVFFCEFAVLLSNKATVKFAFGVCICVIPRILLACYDQILESVANYDYDVLALNFGLHPAQRWVKTCWH